MDLDEREIPYDYYGSEPECESCGSTEVFDTFDGKRVCRYCCHVETVHPRPVNVITFNLRKQYEREEKARRKAEAHKFATDIVDSIITGKDIQDFTHNFFGYKS